jgi:ClpP class serine protease
MTASLSHIAAMRLFNIPLAIHGGKLAAVLDGLGPRVAPEGLRVEGAPERIEHVAFAGGRPSMGRLGDPLGRRIAAQGESKPYAMVGNLAVIAIEGSLIHKGKWIGASSGATSYEGIQAAVRAAADDADVKGVAFEIDSFGGEVAGAFDTAARIRALSAKKPTLAILTDHALSAGYLLASAARRVSMPASGRAGSIGVVMVHTDYSQAIADRGMKVTVLTAGKFKGEGNPYEPLGKDTAARLRADLEAGRRDFAAAVHEGRGKRLSVRQALDTEADDFRGEDAARLGLVDRVEHASDAFDAFAAQINGTATRPIAALKGNRAASLGVATGSAVDLAPEAMLATTDVLTARPGGATSTDLEAPWRPPGLAHGEGDLRDETKELRPATLSVLGDAGAPPALAVVAGDLSAAETKGWAAGRAAGLAEGAADAQARIKGILASDAAKTRRALADKLAFDTDLGVEAAIDILSASPAEVAAGRLAREMASYRQPDLGAGVGPERVAPMTDFEKGAAEARALLGIRPPAASGPSRFNFTA